MALVQSGTIEAALRDRRVVWAVALFPMAFVLGMAVAKLIPRLYHFAVREDSLVEWATAIAYMAAGALARNLWRRQARAYATLYGLLAIGFFLIAMEEISWGQRIFGFHTPHSIEAFNTQGELNFHNLALFHVHEVYIIVTFYGAFARLIIAPLFGRRYPTFVELLTAPYLLFLYFAFPLAYYGYNEFLYYTELLPAGLDWEGYWARNPQFIDGLDQEPMELLLSLGFLAFAVMNWSRYSLETREVEGQAAKQAVENYGCTR